MLASHLKRPYAIGYWSALHHYGLTDQIPETVFIQTHARSKKTLIEMLGVTFRIIRIKEEKIFGLRMNELTMLRLLSLIRRRRSSIVLISRSMPVGSLWLLRHWAPIR